METYEHHQRYLDNNHQSASVGLDTLAGIYRDLSG